MPDLRKMTVESLRALARKVLGPGHSRLKTKAELVSALEEAGAAQPARPSPAPAASPKVKDAAKGAKPGAGARVRAAAGRAVKATGEAVRAAKAAAARATGAGGAGAAAAAAKGAARRGARAAPPPAGEAPAAKGRTKAAAAGARAAQAGAGAAIGAVVGARVGAAPARARKAGKVATAAAAVAGAAVGAALGAAAGARAKKAGAAGAGRRSRAAVPDAEGFFVARVRGEDAVRDAPHPLVEPEPEDEEAAVEEAEGTPSGAPVHDEGLGDLPWGYGDDAFVALPRDPRTLFLYWDWSASTLDAGFQGLDHARAQLWIFARSGAGWERVRVVEFALESRGYYVHDLEPGRTYRAEIHVVDRRGTERLLAHPSTEMPLPPVGPSGVVDDRFIRIPWDLPLGRLLGKGHAGGPFSDEVRALLARLSDWSRFAGTPVWGGSAGGMGGRPSSPNAAPSSPVRPADPREK